MTCLFDCFAPFILLPEKFFNSLVRSPCSWYCSSSIQRQLLWPQGSHGPFFRPSRKRRVEWIWKWIKLLDLWSFSTPLNKVKSCTMDTTISSPWQFCQVYLTQTKPPVIPSISEIPTSIANVRVVWRLVISWKSNSVNLFLESTET